MLKNILCIDRDYKEAAVIEKRRKAEEERKKRFFNERQRVLGIDCEGLKQQLIEKEQKEAMEREELKTEAKEMKKNLEKAEHHERKMQEQRKKLEMEMNEFRKNCQQPKNAKDFDLHDSNDKRASFAARVDDDDARLSISGGQMFMGEDLMNINRIREQKLLQKKWLDQQVTERKQTELNERQTEKEILNSLCKVDAHAVFMENRSSDIDRDIKRQILQYNLSLAQQKRENEKKQKEQEQQDNLAEIYNFLSSDLLKEIQPKSSNLGVNRCIPYAYKQMTPEQIELHRIEQQRQLKDMEKRKNDEENERKKWEEINNEMHRQMTIKERALSRVIRQMNHNVRKENEKLAKEQKCKKEHNEEIMNKNEVTEDFFGQFNTTSR